MWCHCFANVTCLAGSCPASGRTDIDTAFVKVQKAGTDCPGESISDSPNRLAQ